MSDEYLSVQALAERFGKELAVISYRTRDKRIRRKKSPENAREKVYSVDDMRRSLLFAKRTNRRPKG